MNREYISPYDEEPKDPEDPFSDPDPSKETMVPMQCCICGAELGDMPSSQPGEISHICATYHEKIKLKIMQN